HHIRTGGSLRRPWSQRRHVRRVVIVELGTRKPELREHGSTRGRRAHLLLRAQLRNASRDARLSSQARVMKLRAAFIAFATFGLQASSVRAVVTQLTPAGF